MPLPNGESISSVVDKATSPSSRAAKVTPRPQRFFVREFLAKRFLARSLGAWLLLITGAEMLPAQVVQLPSVRRFSSTGGMLIPDRGTGSMGGVSSSQSRRSSRGRFAPGGAHGGGIRAGNGSITATIIDHDEIDRQLLGDADPSQLAWWTAGEETIDDAKALVQNARRLLKSGDRLRAQGTYELALHRLIRLSKQNSTSRTQPTDAATSKSSEPDYMLAYAKREYLQHFDELPSWVPSSARASKSNSNVQRMAEVTP